MTIAGSLRSLWMNNYWIIWAFIASLSDKDVIIIRDAFYIICWKVFGLTLVYLLKQINGKKTKLVTVVEAQLKVWFNPTLWTSRLNIIFNIYLLLNGATEKWLNVLLQKEQTFFDQSVALAVVQIVVKIRREQFIQIVKKLFLVVRSFKIGRKLPFHFFWFTTFQRFQKFFEIVKKSLTAKH